MTLLEAYDEAKANLALAHRLVEAGTWLDVGQYEQAYSQACARLAAAQLAEGE